MGGEPWRRFVVIAGSVALLGGGVAVFAGPAQAGTPVTV
jgi:hypothetical protein